MNPVDIRNLTWEQIQERLEGDREAVYRALVRYPLRTVRELTAKMEWDHLSVAPRVCELCQLGLAKVAGKRRVGNAWAGVYAAVHLEDAHREHKRLTEAASGQLFFGL